MKLHFHEQLMCILQQVSFTETIYKSATSSGIWVNPFTQHFGENSNDYINDSVFYNIRSSNY